VRGNGCGCLKDSWENVVDRKLFTCPSTCQILDLSHACRVDRSAVSQLSP